MPEDHLLVMAFPEPTSGAPLAVFTTRAGGVSLPPFDSLNLGFSTGDDRERVAENRRRLAGVLGVGLGRLVLAAQVHGVNVARVGPDDGGRGFLLDRPAMLPADGLVTDAPQLALVGLFADCVPIYVWDAATGAFGLGHAGWRGTVDGMAGRLVAAMAEHFGSRPDNLRAIVGPSIGPCHYEVDAPVLGRLRAAFPDWPELVEPTEADRARLNLKEANRRALIRSGLASSRVAVSDVCTACPDLPMFSHRRDGPRTGRMAAVVGHLLSSGKG